MWRLLAGLDKNVGVAEVLTRLQARFVSVRPGSGLDDTRATRHVFVMIHLMSTLDDMQYYGTTSMDPSVSFTNIYLHVIRLSNSILTAV